MNATSSSRAAALPRGGRRMRRGAGAGPAPDEGAVTAPAPLHRDRRLRSQLKWLIGIRLVVVSSVILLHLLLQLQSESGTGGGYLYPLAGVCYGISLCYLMLLGIWRRVVPQAYLQFGGDLAFVTTLVYWSGSISSPLYLVVIAVAAALLVRRAALLVAMVAWLLYAGLQLLLHFGVIATAPGTIGDPSPINLLFYILFSHLVGFAAVALLTSHLAGHVTRAERELETATSSLEELEVLHRDVIESISSGLITTDLEGTIIGVNRAGREILGAREPDLLGHPVDQVGLLSADQWQRLSDLSPQGGRVRDEGEARRGDRSLWIGFSISDLKNAIGESRGYIVIFQDLTDTRKLQEEVRIKDRMAAVGELAAGIAHEIGNPLAAISGSVQLLLRSKAELGARGKRLEIILQESRRLDRTIKGFLKFARPRDRAAVRFDVAKLLEENLTLLRNSDEVSDTHDIRLDLDQPSTLLTGDPDQISQIFWNLTRNAIRAMPAGGALLISGRARHEFYEIEFKDTGRGMTGEERARVFQPFQSFFDAGTGIGMAIVYRIVEEHGGRISVASEPGSGTLVSVTLPLNPVLEQLEVTAT